MSAIPDPTAYAEALQKPRPSLAMEYRMEVSPGVWGEWRALNPGDTPGKAGALVEYRNAEPVALTFAKPRRRWRVTKAGMESEVVAAALAVEQANERTRLARESAVEAWSGVTRAERQRDGWRLAAQVSWVAWLLLVLAVYL